ncbi:germin-like protein subfamily 3 member 4 [Impatiens glandulifera]|uniref:germin-like protein subfamily 3 member 4 n=1 Tax=Impatiens glandulifera TaxID=253017 RepID=UPI001FB18BF0|nr:germin-like protein subfamily 3 member 4 [Impatiens glandulifera]
MMIMKMMIIIATFFIYLATALHGDNLQDMCPSNIVKGIFLNGFPCINPANVTASDFKSSILSQPGEFDDFTRSSSSLLTAAEFPGLNTLGLAVGRTDLEIDGIVTPHTHPRSSEMIFVAKGKVAVGFIDTQSVIFQKVLEEGEVFVFPRGLLHYYVNTGFGTATLFSMYNSQNPGMWSIVGGIFQQEELIKKKLVSLSTSGAERVENVDVFAF